MDPGAEAGMTPCLLRHQTLCNKPLKGGMGAMDKHNTSPPVITGLVPVIHGRGGAS